MKIPSRLTLTDGPAVTFDAPKQGERRRFEMIAYTGAPMHAPLVGKVVIDLKGLNAQGERKPILRQHDDNRIAGYSDSISKGTDLRVSGVLSDSTEAGREVAALAAEGFPWQASVGININRMDHVKAGDTIEVNGAQFAGPGVVIRDSTLKETSFVPLGADGATSAVVFSDGGGTIEVPNIEEPKMELTLESLKASAPAVYQAAFDEGKAAGISEATPKPATVNELKAAFPNDSQFVIDQLGENATVAGAKAAFADVLTAKLDALTKERDELKAQLAKASEGQAALTLAAPTATPAAPVIDPNDHKAVAGSEWDSDENVRKGFSSKDRYVAFRSAELSGALRVVGK